MNEEQKRDTQTHDDQRAHPPESNDPHVNRAPDYKAQYGRVQAGVWSREIDGRTLYSVSLSRSYKDQYDRWQRTTQLDEDDLLPGAKALDDAYSWIQRQRQAHRLEGRDELRMPPRASNG